MAHEPADEGGALVFVLSGPAGVGKTALVSALRDNEPSMYFCITATTRSPRVGEQHGRDYYFYTEEEFALHLQEGSLLEHARVPPTGGRLYGTPRHQIDQAIRLGRDVFLQVDVQGARSVRARIPNAITIFLLPPGAETLRERLIKRGTEPTPEMERRLSNALVELACAEEFDYSVVNDEGKLEEAAERVRGIMRDEHARPSPRYAVIDPELGR